MKAQLEKFFLHSRFSGLVLIAVLLAAWQISALYLLETPTWPPVTQILDAWYDNVADGTLLRHLLATLWRQMLGYGLAVVASVFVLKLAASAISLGSGFRGGLFFASLFLGALLGKMFAEVMAFVSPATGIDPAVAAVVGMTSLAVGVVGGPLTMTFLALESTRDLTLTGVVLAASIMAAILVRETFGYSFSTWRFHLRGETIRSAHDVGWMRSLTVGSMMRKDVRTIDASKTLAAFRQEVALGSAQRVVAVDADRHYMGVLIVAELHSDLSDGETPVLSLARFKDAVLVPTMNVQSAAETFQRAGAEELAVVEDFTNRVVVGLLTEGHLMRRYAEELDKARRDLSGEG